MDIDFWELLKDLWLLYSIGKEIYTQYNARRNALDNLCPSHDETIKTINPRR